MPEQNLSKQVEKFITELCDILKISAPEIVEDNNSLPTETMMAAYCIGADENVLYLKPVEKPTPDLMFCIAHELRHKWQYEKKKAVFFKWYRPITECEDVEKYNNQLAELDAHAFAAIVMVNYFGLEPQFSSLSDKTKREIKRRVKDIVDNWSVE